METAKTRASCRSRSHLRCSVGQLRQSIDCCSVFAQCDCGADCLARLSDHLACRPDPARGLHAQLRRWPREDYNATITPPGTSGGVSVFASGATQFIFGIDGYFVLAGTNAAGLQFFPIAPCRISILATLTARWATRRWPQHRPRLPSSIQQLRRFSVSQSVLLERNCGFSRIARLPHRVADWRNAAGCLHAQRIDWSGHGQRGHRAHWD